MSTMEDQYAPDSTAEQAVADTPRTKKGFLRFPRTWVEVKRLGWKFILAFVVFYLIRDTLLYIVLPYLIIKGVISL